MSAAETRTASRAAQLTRLGFGDGKRAATLFDDKVFDNLIDADGKVDAGLARSLAAAADPDQAVLGLVRFLESAGAPGVPELERRLLQDSPLRRRLIPVLGASTAFIDHLSLHPDHWTALAEHSRPDAGQIRAELLTAVGADPDAPVPVATLTADTGRNALRVAYRRRLLSLAGRDLAHPTPATIVDRVAGELADLAAAALETALAVARADLPGHGLHCRLTVIGMGKCGGCELNYVSDVDVIYVAEPVDGADEAGALETGALLAQNLATICSATTHEGTLWPVDAALRPEGKDGPLVRTVASHLAYYRRWAKSWEFQALLKARPVAGDRELGARYLEAINPLVWEAAGRENFVADSQAMRRRVEQHINPKEAERQIKLGRGGLRDVEFSVQLLQLVHGRIEPRLRTGNTLRGLEALSTHGFIGREDAAALESAYRTLRVLEHRLQLARMRRTHVMPTAAADLRRLARSARVGDQETLAKLWRDTRAIVRPLHERLYYRPILAAAALLTTDEAKLSPESAKVRLKALGYQDPDGAMRHLQSLTAGVSRRAAIQRQLLPVLLGWFAEGADPDGGLLAFRKVSDSLGSLPWYLKMLRDSGAAAERLAHLLSSGQFAAELISRTPEATRWLDNSQNLRHPGLPRMKGWVDARVSRIDDVENAVMAGRGIRSMELLRTAICDLVGLIGLREVGHELSDGVIAAMDAALKACARAVLADQGRQTAPTRLAIISMGRLGGGELAYSSDADVMFVHDPVPGADVQDAQEYAHLVFSTLQRTLKRTGTSPPLDIDTALRPEGRDGPLVRSLASYAEYYRRWSVGWEAQALLRAVPVAGDEALGAEFVTLIDPLRYPPGGLAPQAVREVRRIKARVESERLPRGVDPKQHLKLGPGGLTDVEWTVQLLQLQHAHEVLGLRTPGTLEALRNAEQAGLLDPADLELLENAWMLCGRVRNAIMLWKGRGSDTLPSSARDRDGIGRILGYDPDHTLQLEDDILRTMRLARGVVQRVFYGEPSESHRH